ncbi:MAG: DUF4347 domain-containing protein [Cyanobacteria bacterium RM1_2_2]|nr:DUF4347 domain-containing protein [Cyanobacteria bacterium RM1_2_2]
MQSSKSLILWPEPHQALSLVQPLDKTAKVLTVVDPTVPNYVALVRKADAAEVLVLEPEGNGIEQVTDRLTSRSANLEKLQMIVHGQPGKVQLGAVCLDQETLNRYANVLQSWRQALMPDAKILLYGNTIVMGTEGMAFMGRLSQLTGALVETWETPQNPQLVNGITDLISD